MLFLLCLLLGREKSQELLLKSAGAKCGEASQLCELALFFFPTSDHNGAFHLAHQAKSRELLAYRDNASVRVLVLRVSEQNDFNTYVDWLSKISENRRIAHVTLGGHGNPDEDDHEILLRHGECIEQCNTNGVCQRHCTALDKDKTEKPWVDEQKTKLQFPQIELWQTELEKLLTKDANIYVGSCGGAKDHGEDRINIAGLIALTFPNHFVQGIRQSYGPSEQLFALAENQLWVKDLANGFDVYTYIARGKRDSFDLKSTSRTGLQTRDQFDGSKFPELKV